MARKNTQPTKPKTTKSADNTPSFTQSKVPGFGEATVRMAVIDSELWFVGSDVCKILDIDNAPHAMSKLDSDEKDTIVISDSVNRPHNNTIINESGLYNLIFSSRKAEAKQFKKWITSEVIPSIRKHGTYISDTATQQQVEYAIENKIVDMLIAHSKVDQKGIRPLPKALNDAIINMYESKPLYKIRHESIDYINERLTSASKRCAHKALYNASFRWSVDKYHSKQLVKRGEDAHDIHETVSGILRKILEHTKHYLLRSNGQLSSKRVIKAKARDICIAEMTDDQIVEKFILQPENVMTGDVANMFG